jgi:hypothetical protein
MLKRYYPHPAGQTSAYRTLRKSRFSADRVKWAQSEGISAEAFKSTAAKLELIGFSVPPASVPVLLMERVIGFEPTTLVIGNRDQCSIRGNTRYHKVEPRQGFDGAFCAHRIATKIY